MKFLWITALSMFAAVVPAMADGWRVSLGASYRTFDDVSFKPLTLSATPGDRFVNGDWAGENDYSVLSDAQVVPGWDQAGDTEWLLTVKFDETTFEGLDEEMDATPGAVLGLSKVFYVTDSNWWFTGKVSLSWFASDIDASASEGNGLSTTTWVGKFLMLSPNDPNLFPDTFPIVGGQAPNWPLYEPVEFPDAQATTASRLAMDAEMDLYVLSFGVQAGHAFGPIALILEAGPTLNLVNFETSVQQTIAWDGGGIDRSESDDSLDVLLGVYAAGGITWRFMENFDLAVEARWDEVFGEAETDQAEMDLSGASFSLTLGYYF